MGPHRRSMRGAEGCYLGRSRAYSYALRAAVVADAVVDDSPVDDHIAFVNIGDTDASEIIDGAIVSKVVAMPVASLITDSDVTEAVVDTAVEADIAAPIAVVEAVAATDKAPVAGRPESSLIRRRAPCPGNPVIAG